MSAIDGVLVMGTMALSMQIMEEVAMPNIWYLLEGALDKKKKFLLE